MCSYKLQCDRTVITVDHHGRAFVGGFRAEPNCQQVRNKAAAAASSILVLELSSRLQYEHLMVIWNKCSRNVALSVEPSKHDYRQ